MAVGVTIDGAFAEYIRLPGQAVIHGNLAELGENVSYEEAAVNEALSCVYNGFLQYGVHVGDYVMVIGAGPIGVMHAKLARLAGAAKVMLNDISAERLEQAARVDPSFIGIPSEGVRERVRKETKGKGLDVCVTACPVPAAQALALELAGFGGRVNFFGGLPKSAEVVPLNSNLIHYKQLHVSGSTKANTAMVRKTLELVDSGVLSVKEIITSRYPLAEIGKAIAFAAAGGGLKTIIDIS
jgi:L-iditol 2-dehydrogenase